MKKFALKLFCILLAAFFAATGLSVMPYARDADGFAEFADTVVSMLEKNPVEEDEGEDDVGSAPGTSGFESARLIVKASGFPDSFGALSRADGYKNLHIFQYASPGAAAEAYDRLVMLEGVEYVEADTVVSADADISAPREPISWGTDFTVSYETNKYLFDTGASLSPVTVAVLDSGVNSSHELLEGRVTATGYNFCGSGAAGSSEDDFGHGTHVAGIIVCNTLSNVTVRAYKVLDSAGDGSISAVVLGIEQAVLDGADIINMSLGASGTSAAVDEAVADAYKSGAAVVVSAGNDGVDTDATSYFPACSREAITVSSIGKGGELSSFSNYGSCVDLTAPGEMILSADHKGGTRLSSGTSMAAPFVCAAAATAEAFYGGLTPSEISKILTENAVDIPSNGKVSAERAFGNGLVSFADCLNFPNRVSAPEAAYEMDATTSEYRLTVSGEEGAQLIYTTDFSVPSEKNGSIYSQSAVLASSCTVMAAAFAPGRFRSKTVCLPVETVYFADESEFSVNSSGIIAAYSGDVGIYLSVPKKIGGITVTGVGESALAESGLTGISLPDTVTLLADSALAGNPRLQYVDAKNIQSIGQSALSGCTRLTDFDFSEASSISSLAFFNCSSLKAVDAPALTQLHSRAFEGCLSVESVSAPILTSLPAQAFSGCALLREASFPLAKAAASKAFYSCVSLEKLCLDRTEAISASCFSKCSFAVLELPCAVEVASLPADCTVAFSGRLTVCTVSAASFGDGKICGFSGTYAEQWAQSHDVEFVPAPIITADLPAQIPDGAQALRVQAVGVNNSYQWFTATSRSRSDARAIDGEQSSVLSPAEGFTAPYYFCVVTSACDGLSLSKSSAVSLNLRAPADYSALNAALAAVPESLAGYTSRSASALKSAISLVTYDKTIAEQSTVDEWTRQIELATSELAPYQVRSIKTFFLLLLEILLRFFGIKVSFV